MVCSPFQNHVSADSGDHRPEPKNQKLALQKQRANTNERKQ
jgi:hypothetical protein